MLLFPVIDADFLDFSKTADNIEIFLGLAFIVAATVTIVNVLLRLHIKFAHKIKDL